MYNINCEQEKKDYKLTMAFCIIVIIILLVETSDIALQSEIFSIPKSDMKYIYLFLILLIGTIISETIKYCNYVKKIRELNKSGVLYKNVPYILESTGNVKARLHKFKIKLELPSKYGATKKYEKIFELDICDKTSTGFIDIVIDEEKDLFHMDFEINRIEGNKENDYYTSPEELKEILKNKKIGPIEEFYNKTIEEENQNNV